MGTFAVLVRNRHRMVGLLVGVIVAGAALLAYPDVEGFEWRQIPDEEAGGSGGWSHHGALAGRAHSLTLSPGDDQTSSPQRTVRAQEEIPVEVRRPSIPATPIPLATPDGNAREQIVPVLMYHHIADPGPGADAIRLDLSVSPDRFEDQLRYLVEHDYEPTTLESLVLHLQAGRPLPAKPVILTFDDGFRDQYTAAYPLLRKYGFVGTFFVITLFADEGRPDYLSWAEIELLHAGGMEIGSHSYTHPSLKGKTFDYIVWQVLGSKEAIEARTCEPVRFFSYPSGQYDQLVVDVLRSAGYWTAVTVEPGSLQSSGRLFELKRIRVRGSYELDDFDYWLNHWLSSP